MSDQTTEMMTITVVLTDVEESMKRAEKKLYDRISSLEQGEGLTYDHHAQLVDRVDALHNDVREIRRERDEMRAVVEKMTMNNQRLLEVVERLNNRLKALEGRWTTDPRAQYAESWPGANR